MYVTSQSIGQRTQAARRLATRQALIAAARESFAALGYAETPTEEIVRRAAVTRGALYHHFADKKGLFRAVVEGIEREIDERVRTAARSAANAADAFVAGCDAFLDACLLPDVEQILLLDGPSVLGWQEWHDVDARHALAQIELGLQELIEAGRLEDQPIRALAHLIHGALIEAALVIAASDDPGAVRTEMGASLQRLLGLPGGSTPPAVPNQQTG
jgi:AcrR family transcriptional regulator